MVSHVIARSPVGDICKGVDIRSRKNPLIKHKHVPPVLHTVGLGKIVNGLSSIRHLATDARIRLERQGNHVKSLLGYRGGVGRIGFGQAVNAIPPGEVHVKG